MTDIKAALQAAGLAQASQPKAHKATLKELSNQFRNPIAEKLFAEVSKEADAQKCGALIQAAVKQIEDAQTTADYIADYNKKHVDAPKDAASFAAEEIRWSLMRLAKGKDLD